MINVPQFRNDFPYVNGRCFIPYSLSERKPMRMFSSWKVALCTAMFVWPSMVIAQQPSPPDETRVYILWPPDGQVIHGAFWVRMGLHGAGIAPAGVEKAGTGHHHLLVDVPLPPLSDPIPNDKNHLHFGLGQTEARLDLPPGKHTLQLLFGDANHVPQNPPLYSPPVTITVIR